MNKTISSTSDRATVTKILAIRAKAGNDGTKCPTCTRPAGSGFRTCVDACHVAQETLAIGSRATWLTRPAARQIRRDLLTFLQAH